MLHKLKRVGTIMYEDFKVIKQINTSGRRDKQNKKNSWANFSKYFLYFKNFTFDIFILFLWGVKNGQLKRNSFYVQHS